MIGMAAALCLGDRFKVALIDSYLSTYSSSSSVAPLIKNAADEFNLRVTALNNSSLLLMERLDAKDKMSRLASFRKIEVWEESSPPLVFDCAKINKPQLGYIVENDIIQNAFMQQIQKNNSISIISQKVMDCNSNNNKIKLENGSEYRAQLIIGADGRDSLISRAVGVGSIKLNHPQMALVINVKTSYPQRETSWQRFTPDGAQAFLPLAGNNASLVWYNNPDYNSFLIKCNEEQFTNHLCQSYPARLGNISVENRASFSVQCHHLEKYFHNRIVLVGDAAHSIHPLAGQGANLGFKDIEALDDILKDKSCLSVEKLAEYQTKRYKTNALVFAFMESLYYGFGNAIPEVQLLRRAAMQLASIPPVNKFLIKEATGDSLLQDFFS